MTGGRSTSTKRERWQTVTVTAGQRGSAVQRMRIRTAAGTAGAGAGTRGHQAVQVGGPRSTGSGSRPLPTAPLGSPSPRSTVPGSRYGDRWSLPDVPDAWGPQTASCCGHCWTVVQVVSRSASRVPCVEGREVARRGAEGLDRIVRPARLSDVRRDALAARPLAGAGPGHPPSTGPAPERHRLVNGRARPARVGTGCRGRRPVDRVDVRCQADVRPQLDAQLDRRASDLPGAGSEWRAGRRCTSTEELAAPESPDGAPDGTLDDRGVGDVPTAGRRRPADRSCSRRPTRAGRSTRTVGVATPGRDRWVRLLGVPFEPQRLPTDARPWPCGTGPAISWSMRCRGRPGWSRARCSSTAGNESRRSRASRRPRRHWRREIHRCERSAVPSRLLNGSSFTAPSRP